MLYYPRWNPDRSVTAPQFHRHDFATEEIVGT